MGVAGSNRKKPRSRASATRKSSPAATSSRASASKNGHAALKLHSLSFTIPSDLAASRDVQKKIMDRVEALHYGPESTFAINLALEEGLVNAVKHGNQHDPGKRVHVEADVNPKRAQITIQDQGRGFARSRVPDPCADENLMKCSGRGILLMEAYMDKVQYSQGGRRVRMVKKNI